jgi:hypothetical protein
MTFNNLFFKKAIISAIRFICFQFDVTGNLRKHAEKITSKINCHCEGYEERAGNGLIKEISFQNGGLMCLEFSLLL